MKYLKSSAHGRAFFLTLYKPTLKTLSLSLQKNSNSNED